MKLPIDNYSNNIFKVIICYPPEDSISFDCKDQVKLK